MSRGFIKIHRKILEWEWYTNTNVMRLFFHCILKANWEDKRWKGQIIKRGSFITSIQHLSKETRLTYQQTRTALKKLIETGEISRFSTNQSTMITIDKYDEYQDDKRPSNKRTTNEQQTDNKRITTTKEDKKIRRKEKNIYTQNFLDIWEVYPKTRIGNQDRAYSAYKSAIKRDTEENINQGIQAYIDCNESKNYPKGLAAWFNDDRWKNDYNQKGSTDGRSKTASDAARLLEQYGDTGTH